MKVLLPEKVLRLKRVWILFWRKHRLVIGQICCFRANSDIRLFTGTTTRSDGLKFKDLDHINDSGSVGDGSDDGGETPDPDGGSGGNGEAPDPAA